MVKQSRSIYGRELPETVFLPLTRNRGIYMDAVIKSFEFYGRERCKKENLSFSKSINRN